MREFKTGATRNSDEGKNDYDGFLSFLVIQEFGNYMNKHRVQADGKLRDSDNWQKGFGERHYDVCMKSAFRHFLDFWAIHRGYKRYDSIDGHEITLTEAGCAILFNIMAYMHIFLKPKDSRPFIEKGKEE
jgi:hypothetical protein